VIQQQRGGLESGCRLAAQDRKASKKKARVDVDQPLSVHALTQNGIVFTPATKRALLKSKRCPLLVQISERASKSNPASWIAQPTT
jgi:hypothetical protein